MIRKFENLLILIIVLVSFVSCGLESDIGLIQNQSQSSVETNKTLNELDDEMFKYKVFDNPSGRARIENGERLEIVEPPILTNDLNCLDLFKDFTSVSFLVKKDTDSGLAIVNLDKDSDNFDSLVEIFDGCYFSPIDYEIHPNGAGYYWSNNSFECEPYFSLGYVPDDYPDTYDYGNFEYESISLTFIKDETEYLFITLFENLNLIVTSRTLINETENILNYNYELPYSLNFDNAHLYSDLVHFFITSDFESVDFN